MIQLLHNNPRISAKTLFATHYHELTDAADYLPRVRNFHLAVEEKDGEVRIAATRIALTLLDPRRCAIQIVIKAVEEAVEKNIPIEALL